MIARALGLAPLFALIGGGCASPAPESEPRADVVVYGDTSAAVIAAVQTARAGRSVVLLAPSAHLGGLSSGGLGATDIGDKRAIGGMSREFYRRIRAYYDDESAWKFEARDAFRGRGHRPGEDTAWTFEPHVAERIFDEMLAETGVRAVRGRLARESGVRLDGGRILSIRTERGRVFPGAMFIDATYEGDLMAAAGVSYTVGREPNATYGETLNGVQAERAIHHQFTEPVDPYVVPGDPASGLLFGIQMGGPGEKGAGDDRVQAYCFRICATDVPENRLPWPKPADYDPAHYELLLRNFEAGDHRLPWNPVRMPNGKTDSNNNFAVSTDFIGASRDYPEADYATRARIVADHERWQKGLLWTLANHPRVPDQVREAFSAFGLARDEFPETDGWPRQIYVREARRMVSDYVMTEHNAQRRIVAADSVGMGAYNMDSHHVQRYVTAAGAVRNEGDVQVRSLPYPISYRSIVPRRGECTNLFTPVCLSASHIAFGSIRMEPVFMVLGQSSAIAACLALELGVAVQDVPYDALRERLVAAEQVLDFTTEPAAGAAVGIRAETLPGIVVDDTQATLIGDWTMSTSAGTWVGPGYLHDGDEGKGTKSVRFETPLPRPGRYEVRLAWTPHSNRAGTVPVAIEHATGTSTVVLDQREAPGGTGPFRSLGVHQFGTTAAVVVGTLGTTGYVVADAVQFLPVP
ncbi:MAG: FAD-dependent oxidoreductase [Planctomycetota bacterium]|nr:MAG: FAD-dependent oxidoreductase [Planctomycetota bacterium]